MLSTIPSACTTKELAIGKLFCQHFVNQISRLRQKRIQPFFHKGRQRFRPVKPSIFAPPLASGGIFTQYLMTKEFTPIRRENLPSIRPNRPTFLGEGGRLPPQAVDLEEAVLGALMLEREALTSIIDLLKAESFYKDEHKEIYSAVLDLFERSQPIDMLTVANALRSRGTLESIGGAFYISELTNRVASAANIEFHARIIAQKFILRELIKLSSEIQRDAFDETIDVFTLLDKSEQALFAISEGNVDSQSSSMQTLVQKAIQHMEELRMNEGNMSGLPSGFTELDRITSGWQPSDLVIVAARPGMGKTAFVMAIARNAAVDFKKPVAVFSLEMSSVQLVLRLISSEAEISATKLKNGTLEDHEWQQMNNKIQRLAGAEIYLDESPAINIFDLRAKCRRLKAQHNIQMVVIDYLQLMSGPKDGRNSGNREQEISQISRSLKGLAKELNIPVIALSQLSREVERRGGEKRPILSDLRESGSIEQDADMVMFLYRPEYYSKTDADGNSTEGVAELIIAKNRHGATDTVKLKWVDRYAKFEDPNENFYSNDAITTTAGFNAIIKGSRMNDESDDSYTPF